MNGFAHILNSIVNQYTLPEELIVIDERKAEKSQFEIGSVSTIVIKGNFKNQSEKVNHAIKKCTSNYVLYIDNSVDEIRLKRSYIDTAMLIVEKYPNFGMLYADYDLLKDETRREIRLLKHHAGRLRDNQDFGKVFFFSKDALKSVKLFDESLKYRALYDIRLKLSEKFDIVHVANKVAGSLYEVVAESKAHNVFDYLLVGKAVNREAEAVLTKHLQRVGAYLEPGKGYHKRPEPSKDAQFVVSVIIPVNRRPEFIETALSSVFHQTVQDIEVIVVVNGGDDDPTIQEVRKYMPEGSLYDETKPSVRLVVADVNNIGLSLDFGVKIAQGKYYVQLDSDDMLKPDAVEKIMKVYQSDEKIGMVIGSYEVWEKRPNGEFIRMEQIPIVTHDEWTEENGRNNLLHINGAGAPRSIPIQIIKEMGYFGINDEPYAQNYGEDYDLVMKISEKYRIVRVWDPIYEVVRHSGGTDHSIDQQTIDRNDEAKDYMRLIAVGRRQKLNAK
ncbi:MAG: glycosyl transferase family 2 [Candidatus Marinimicrobia bacterium CG08_land_8_20_14_0_20_45_22]|nr:MAG: glycosyl transferase family 2 [Candidatus Marinimicrobia bacterium CG08_land_8_20_14_0_20_45_22]